MSKVYLTTTLRGDIGTQTPETTPGLLELSCIKKANQSILARDPKEALWLIIGGKDKRQ
ncbi:MAG: hypothetical protein ACYS9Y_04545 [Planctomycetota bacterium]|jgi:hypothetical protein